MKDRAELAQHDGRNQERFAAQGKLLDQAADSFRLILVVEQQ